MFVEGILPATRGRLAAIGHDAPLIEAARLLARPQTNLVVVRNIDSTLAGVITKSDVVNRISQCNGSSCTIAASMIMTRDVTVCGPRDSLDYVWSMMKKHGRKHVPVIDEQSHPIGVLYARDALQILLEEVEYEELLLRDYVMGVGYG